MPHSHALGLLVRKLRSVANLSADEEQAVMTLPVALKQFRAGEDFVHEGDRPEHCALIVRGWACRHKSTTDGKRQILSIHFSGEIPDLQSLLLRSMDHSLSAMTDAEIGYIPHGALNATLERCWHLTRPLWRTTLIDGAIYREWLLAAGRLDTAQHMGHLFCELYRRLEAVGMAASDEYEFSITQAELGDVLGLSSVHVNRTVQALRRRGLVEWPRGRVKTLDFEALARFSQFTPDYLHHVA